MPVHKECCLCSMGLRCCWSAVPTHLRPNGKADLCRHLLLVLGLTAAQRTAGQAKHGNYSVH